MIWRTVLWLAAAILSCVLAGCGVGAPQHAPGELGRQFAATVPGTWTGVSSRGGLECQMVKQFNRDGSARGVLMVKKRSGGVSLVMPEIPFTSRWRVKGDVVETYNIKAGVPGIFKADQVIRDTVLSVSPNRIVSRSNESGEIEIIRRLSSIR